MKGITVVSPPARGTRAGRLGRRLRLVALTLSAAFAFTAVQLGGVPFIAPKPPPAAAATYTPISGAGSTWAYPAIHAWTQNLTQFGMTINYQPNGSTSGRQFFAGGQTDFAASEIPYGVVDGNNTDSPPQRGFIYMPDVAGGTTFMYNLFINGQQVTNLRLSGATIAGIFTNKITTWNDPAIKADNPGLSLPALAITPVVRSDGSGATADFTQWMLATQTAAWQAYCQVIGRSPCTQTSVYPVQPGTAMIGQQGDPGVATLVSSASSNGAIGYVEYSWALQKGFPVAKVLNAAGYYTLPSPGHIAVSLLQDQINTDSSNPATYLTQNLANVYTNTDPRNYELSAYSYLILPTDTSNNMSAAKGNTIGAFGQYALCLGQSQVDVLGYSALPINLVEAGFTQLAKVPGASIPASQTSQLASCNNPTFSTNGTNTLAVNDPQPLACDKQGSTQCAEGVAEPTEAGAQTGTGGAGSGTTGSTTTTTGGTSTTTGGTSTTTGGTSTTTGGTSTTTGGTSTTTGGTSTTTGGKSTTTGGSSTTTGGSSTTAGGSSPSSSSTTGSGQNCDPNTGVCTPAGGSATGSTGAGTGTGTTTGTGTSEVGLSAGQAVNDTPITLAGSNGDGTEVTLMALAAGMMFLLGVVPPLIAQAGRRSRQRRGIDEFYDDDRWEGR